MFGLFLSKEERDKKREQRRKEIKQKNREKIAARYKKDNELEEIEKKIALFNISEIGQDYKALGYVESRNKHQKVSRQLICEEAYKMGANAIINLNLQTETKVSGGGSSISTASKRLLSDDVTIQTSSEKISSNTIYIYTGTAVYIEN